MAINITSIFGHLIVVLGLFICIINSLPVVIIATDVLSVKEQKFNYCTHLKNLTHFKDFL